jgi:putative acetyltransferase
VVGGPVPPQHGDRGRIVTPGVIVREYREGDAQPICRLFYETVRSVNLADYSPEQVRAWAPEVPDPEAWHRRMSGRHTLVAEDEEGVAGFAELEEDGHLDMLYCRRDAVGGGVGSALCAVVEERARHLGLAHVFTEASITARPFFGRRGFLLVRRNVEVRRGVELVNFSMHKPLR